MKKVGITGPPGSGKTTLWRAITGGVAHGNAAVIGVPDERLDNLARLHSSPRQVPVQIELVDAHASRSHAEGMARLREMDAIVAVVPEFSGGGLDLDEQILADLGPVETRLRSAKKEVQSAKEAATLEVAMRMLSGGRPLRESDWEPADISAFSPLGLLTLKPVLEFHNDSEDLKLESEVVGMDQSESRELLREYGINEPVAGRLVRQVFELLDLITFYTMNEKETRAWELRRGAKAPEAAGGVHTDMERGFIRAEVCSFEKVAESGSWDAARAANLVKVEGKDYVVQDGDVLKFRFSV